MNKSIIYGTLIATAGLFFTSCEKLSSINENPNEPSNVGSGVLFTEGTRSSLFTSVHQSYLLGNNAAQLSAKSLRTEVDAYSWNSFSNVWVQNYQSLANLAEAEMVAEVEENEQMQGAAKVMKAWVFSTLTLAYGDIPYSEAISGSSSNQWFPKYDSQQEIITGSGGLLEELSTAATLLKGDGSVQGDILYGGDADKWVRLANALQLRLLMHISGQQDVSAAFADLYASADLMEANAHSAELTYTGNFPNEFPLVPLKQGDFDAVYLSTNAHALLTSLDDPRLYSYARPVNADEVLSDPSAIAVYDGAENGLETGTCDKSGSRLGYAYYNYPSHPQAEQMAKGIIMTYAEQQFLLAEAAHNGWITEDAATLMASAVEASFEQYNVDFSMTSWADASDYLANSGAAYDGTINSIRKQKWLSLFFSGLEPYFELRRWYAEEGGMWANLGFVTAPCLNTNGDELPMRFLYPGNEESLNPTNYQAAVNALGGNSQNAKMWVVDL